MLADNRLAENAGWDDDVLMIELQHLSEVELNFSIEVTGFETAEINFLLDNGRESAAENLSEDDGSEFTDTEVTQTSDIWHFGHHRLICADSLQGKTL